jgi:hypothetical protein
MNRIKVGVGKILRALSFPEELGQCRGTPLIFFDTNAIIDNEGLVRYVFGARIRDRSDILGVICDFIEGEARNLKQGVDTLNEIKDPGTVEFDGIFFKTKYNSYEESKRSLEDMPSAEMAEAVRVEYDKVPELAFPANLKPPARNPKSNFGDFSLLTVAAVSAFRRKRQSIIVTRDRMLRSACESLRSTFGLMIFCQDQFGFSMKSINDRVIGQ